MAIDHAVIHNKDVEIVQPLVDQGCCCQCRCLLWQNGTSACSLQRSLYAANLDVPFGVPNANANATFFGSTALHKRFKLVQYWLSTVVCTGAISTGTADSGTCKSPCVRIYSGGTIGTRSLKIDPTYILWWPVGINRCWPRGAIYNDPNIPRAGAWYVRKYDEHFLHLLQKIFQLENCSAASASTRVFGSHVVPHRGYSSFTVLL